jgi:hypothetical protein
MGIGERANFSKKTAAPLPIKIYRMSLISAEFISLDSTCAAKAFYSCPAIISRRPRSQNILKEPQLNPEKDSRRKQDRSHVTLEKSS